MFIYSAEFKKRFKRLHRKIQERLAERLEVFALDEFDPSLQNHALHGEFGECRSINITGDYRLVYRTIEKRVYLLISIGTHSQLYE